MEASSHGLLDAANSKTIDVFLQQHRKQSKKLRTRGGFQAAFPLYQMNRHKQQTPENQNRKQTSNKKNP